jgi:hypothetical protein
LALLLQYGCIQLVNGLYLRLCLVCCDVDLIDDGLQEVRAAAATAAMALGVAYLSNGKALWERPYVAAAA